MLLTRSAKTVLPYEAWTKSEAFRAAHSRAGDNKPLYLGHPQFEGFEVCQTV
jgi:heme-degrading monooxygenase HmoA